MNKKFLRLGLTETTLLFFYWYHKKINRKDKDIDNGKEFLIKWLYTTSGYYDKTIKSSYFDAKHNINDPQVYLIYFEKLYNFIKDSDNFHYGVHYDRNKDNFINFINDLNIKNNIYMGNEFIYNLIKDKDVLIISPFASLFKKQFDSGNLKKIYSNFEEPCKISYYDYIYTFFNNGPDNNILETVDRMYLDIKKSINNNYSLVIISTGAHSILLAEKFYNDNKDVVTIGGDLQKIFGVLNSRELISWGFKPENPELWIMNIPNEYKPDGFQKIENGCYW